MAPVCTFNPPPGYPASALRQGWEGEVHVYALIGADGRVQSTSVEKTSGYPILDQAALDAVESWRFQSIPDDVGPAERPVSIPVQFRLRRS
jgi:protein TonB